MAKSNLYIDLDESEWAIHGFGKTIREIIGFSLMTQDFKSLQKLGVFYTYQLINSEGSEMITWKQIKVLRNMPSKGKKAKWFQSLENILLADLLKRDLQEEWQLSSSNGLAMKIWLPNLSSDKSRVVKKSRKEIWVDISTPTSSVNDQENIRR
ncbi:5330_t:CDS:2, partial [Dentiscutata heterogama]